LSFETPQGASAFNKQWQPKVNQDLSTKSAKIDEDLFEVSVRMTITVSDGDETIYLIEVDQAGLFSIAGLEDQHVAQLLNTTCASMLFPYAREAIDNVLTKGSFPPLMIPPINFDALYANALQQAAAKAQEGDRQKQKAPSTKIDDLSCNKNPLLERVFLCPGCFLLPRDFLIREL
jgi:preprotein translocase subunit SecB